MIVSSQVYEKEILSWQCARVNHAKEFGACKSRHVLALHSRVAIIPACLSLGCLFVCHLGFHDCCRCDNLEGAYATKGTYVAGEMLVGTSKLLLSASPSVRAFLLLCGCVIDIF